ncbi:hypothetical protein PENANT_c064G10025 [Penicillium antarcticum]|uniref:Uncharacterized protein n=1 Tax=Penicillium antarcticum TaxID=416450 RepID=A0A1V6PR94_9EURO|nr:hypothetical protein PENANT_c064G10025 [Penicillium antarcticum]
MCGILKRQYMLPSFHRSIRRYRSLAEKCPSSCDICSELSKRTYLSPATVPQEPPGAMMDSLLQGYRPKFKPHPLGWEVEALLSLSPAQ